MKTKYFEITKHPEIAYRLTLSSGDGDDYKGCSLTLSGFGYWLNVKLPAIIRPKSTKIFPNPSWDADTVKRLGRDYYHQYDEREYGISLSEGFLSIYYGVQTNSSETTKHWGYFLPWTQNTFIRRTFYNLDGSVYANFPALALSKGMLGSTSWDQEYKASKEVEKIHFSFLDYDLEEITASCYIEEREWHRGEKWCSWLKHFTKPIIRRNLDLSFSSGVGKRKTGWKGGVLGTGTELFPDEEPLDAFLRYCDKENLRFVDIVEAPPEKLTPENLAVKQNPDFGVLNTQVVAIS